jgi:N-formylglutamate deformylase
MHLEVATFVVGDTPLVATAIHDGHHVRPEVERLMALGEAERLREEDPFTGQWVAACETQVVGLRSRFEVDLNRPRDQAVYLDPQDAWGLTVWRERPAEEVIDGSLALYDAFYAEMRKLLDGLVERHGRFVVLDLHTYNHRRDGPDSPPAAAERNPEVNVGTRSITNPRRRPVIDRFLCEARDYPYLGRALDVRENVKFGGGHLAKWINGNYGEHGLDLAIEFKKFFMDEWTGEGDEEQIEEIGRLLRRVAEALQEEVGSL